MDVETAGLEALDTLWDEVKAQERQKPDAKTPSTE
jgi:hypothetical protein